MQKCQMWKLGGKGGGGCHLFCPACQGLLLDNSLGSFSLSQINFSHVYFRVAGGQCSVPLCSALMPYDGCSVCQAQMLLKLFQQSWSAARANVFISSTALCAQEPPIYPSEGNAFWWPSKSLSEASCWETGNCAQAIANNYGRPIGDQDFQVQRYRSLNPIFGSAQGVTASAKVCRLLSDTYQLKVPQLTSQNS